VSGNKDGGPAFPQPCAEIQGRAVNSSEFGFPGMSLRDYFAARALPLLIEIASKSGRDGDPGINVVDAAEQITRRAYFIADAMLAQRDKPENG
jgi:hypothetical protein